MAYLYKVGSTNLPLHHVAVHWHAQMEVCWGLKLTSSRAWRVSVREATKAVLSYYHGMKR